MYKKILIISLTFFCFKSFALEEKKESVDIKKLSEAIGHIIGKNLDELGVELDIKRMIKGIKKASLNKQSPMSEDECIEALAKLQEKINHKTCLKNLKEAEDFLAENIKKDNIIEIEKGKLQYILVKEGKGDEIKSYSTPIIKYSAKFLNGKEINSSEELITLNETLQGLKKGIIGMKEGEKRILYIHPDLAFKDDPTSLNSLVIFDVEIIKTSGKDNQNYPTNEIANNPIKNENHTF
ncbi:MAG: FKBP-type peptidyl-prolyl cis-trans isomerase [Parachlamydiales bacterium]|nr:FKBP-type peptidyl-prolyl cis-trans isomerase [Parachlamydiales bacterium]